MNCGSGIAIICAGCTQALYLLRVIQRRQLNYINLIHIWWQIYQASCECVMVECFNSRPHTCITPWLHSFYIASQPPFFNIASHRTDYWTPVRALPCFCISSNNGSFIKYVRLFLNNFDTLSLSMSHFLGPPKVRCTLEVENPKDCPAFEGAFYQITIHFTIKLC